MLDEVREGAIDANSVWEGITQPKQLVGSKGMWGGGSNPWNASLKSPTKITTVPVLDICHGPLVNDGILKRSMDNT